MNSGSEHISFSESGQFSRIFLDYVSATEKLKPFYPFYPDTNGYQQAMAAMQYEEKNRSVLAASIQKQYEDSGIQLPQELFSKLKESGTLTVTTGHQLCLFTGPLYFITKIATTIRLAEKLEAETGKKIVPVYWMASEDHDFAEIASVNLFGKTISWEKPANGAVGKLPTDSLQTTLEEIKPVLGQTSAAASLFELFSKVYAPGKTLAAATRALVHELFEGKVLILDGDDAELKKLFLSHFENDLKSNAAFSAVSNSIQQLHSLGYDAQVNPREINVFYSGKNFRERIEKDGDKFRVLNTELVFTSEELDAELKNNPAAFSPNVVLRPLYQQTILPNLAYVGGPGELAYWLEYRAMFEEQKTFFPVLQPRSFILLSDSGAQKKMDKLGISIPDLFGDIEELIKKYVSERAGADLRFDSEKAELKTIYDKIISKAESADATLKKTAEAELQKSINSLEALLGKMLRAEKQKQETDINQLRKLHSGFFPNGLLMERYSNFIPFWLQTNGELVRLIENEIDFPVKGISVVRI